MNAVSFTARQESHGREGPDHVGQSSLSGRSTKQQVRESMPGSD